MHRCECICRWEHAGMNVCASGSFRWQCVCMHTCGGQRSNLGVIPWFPSMLPYDEGLSMAQGSPIKLDHLASEHRDLPAYIFPELELHCTQVCLFEIYFGFVYVHMSVHMNDMCVHVSLEAS